MKFSEKWLRTWVNPPMDTQGLADCLTFGGIEIEGVTPVAPAFERVVVGEVLSVEKHPNADRLNVCQVNIGVAPLTIVCGAPNVRAGMRVPVALVGAQLPGMTIKQAKVRGVESSGMLCSAKELGLSDAASGLLALPDDTTIGASVRDVLELDDHIFDSKPTPNRGDCLSLRGIAREVAALSNTTLTLPVITPVAATFDGKPKVTLHAPDGCALYCGRTVRGVNVAAPTPPWMVRRLDRSGVRSISAVVDVTNYVMLELGQPMHAFDAAAIDGGIQVRYARQGEKLELLNGQTRELDPSFLLIADDHKALALAGIMGGVQSAVGDTTRDVVLESAWFNPDVIMGKSRVLGFGSDSSYRFERGVNFAGAREAMERATRLVLDICGGDAGPVVAASAALPQRMPITLRYARVARVLGVTVRDHVIGGLLMRLGCTCESTIDALLVTPPAHRFDIAIEEDLIEEVARVYGYAAIPGSVPVAPAAALPVREQQTSAMSLRHQLAARDYQEVVAYSFVDRAWETDFCANHNPLALANPIASQMAVMRSSLIGGLVQVVAHNLNHRQPRVRVFEVGRCFMVQDKQDIAQPWRIAGAACGEAVASQWGIPARAVDFYDVKGDIEALCAPHSLTFVAEAHPAFHPGKSARVLRSGHTIGWMGELHPKWQQKYELPMALTLFDLDLDAIVRRNLPSHTAVSRFPAVWRDLAAVFDEATPYQVVLDAVYAQKPEAVIDFSVFDIYRGQGIANGKKSLAFRMLVQDTQKTMTDAEVDSAVLDIKKILQDKFNAKLR